MNRQILWRGGLAPASELGGWRPERGTGKLARPLGVGGYLEGGVQTKGPKEKRCNTYLPRKFLCCRGRAMGRFWYSVSQTVALRCCRSRGAAAGLSRNIHHVAGRRYLQIAVELPVPKR